MKGGRIGSKILLGVVLLWTLVPLLWMLMSSLKPQEDRDLDHAAGRLHADARALHRRCSAAATTSAPTPSTRSSPPASRRSSRSASARSPATAWRAASFRGKDHLAFWIISTRMAPIAAVVLPLFVIFRGTRPARHDFGADRGLPVFNLPFAIWIMNAFFADLPPSLEEAALVDGASRWTAFRKIAVPLVLPGIATTAILCLVFSWNDYAFASTFSGPDSQTLPIAASQLVTQTEIDWGQLTAIGTIVVAPMIVVGLVVRKLARDRADPRRGDRRVKAAVLHAPGEIRIEERERPSPGRARCSSRSPRSACAAPTSTTTSTAASGRSSSRRRWCSATSRPGAWSSSARASTKHAVGDRVTLEPGVPVRALPRVPRRPLQPLPRRRLLRHAADRRRVRGVRADPRGLRVRAPRRAVRRGGRADGAAVGRRVGVPEGGRQRGRPRARHRRRADRPARDAVRAGVRRHRGHGLRRQPAPARARRAAPARRATVDARRDARRRLRRADRVLRPPRRADRRHQGAAPGRHRGARRHGPGRGGHAAARASSRAARSG